MAIYTAIFALKATANREIFLEHMRSVRKWFRTQQGFESFELYEGDGTWSVRVVAVDLEAITRILDECLQTPLFANLMGLLKPEFYRFLGDGVEF